MRWRALNPHATEVPRLQLFGLHARQRSEPLREAFDRVSMSFDRVVGIRDSSFNRAGQRWIPLLESLNVFAVPLTKVRMRRTQHLPFGGLTSGVEGRQPDRRLELGHVIRNSYRDNTLVVRGRFSDRQPDGMPDDCVATLVHLQVTLPLRRACR